MKNKLLQSFDIKRYMSIVVIVLAGMLFLFALNMVMEKRIIQKANDGAAHSKVISIGGTIVLVDIASTEAAREKGLSGRSKLAPNTGILFVFESVGMWGFWMKEMSFPIDIIWVDTSGNVITVAKSVSPQSYPDVLYPLSPAMYVLEVPAGFSVENHIKEGSVMTLPKGL